jgi:hypothetical protein
VEHHVDLLHRPGRQAFGQLVRVERLDGVGAERARPHAAQRRDDVQADDLAVPLPCPGTGRGARRAQPRIEVGRERLAFTGRVGAHAFVSLAPKRG